MTSDELKAAAERVRELFNATEFDWGNAPLAVWVDLEKVARAYLASLPDMERLRRESDEASVDAEWLKSECGFYGDDLITHRWVTHSFRLYFVDKIGNGVVMYSGGDKHYKTRGSVRRLCSALGIKLTETDES